MLHQDKILENLTQSMSFLFDVWTLMGERTTVAVSQAAIGEAGDLEHDHLTNGKPMQRCKVPADVLPSSNSENEPCCRVL